MGIHQMHNHFILTINMHDSDSEAFMKECFEQYRNHIRFEDGTFSITAEQMGVGTAGVTGTLTVILLILMLVTACVMQAPTAKKHMMNDVPEGKSHMGQANPKNKK